MARYQVPTTQIEKGWINTNAVSIIRVSDQKLLHTVLLDDLDRGFANPWAVKVSKDGNLLCITSAGNHEIRLIDLPALLEKLDRAADQQLMIHNDLTFISEISQRIQLKGIGPRAMVKTRRRATFESRQALSSKVAAAKAKGPLMLNEIGCRASSGSTRIDGISKRK